MDSKVLTSYSVPRDVFFADTAVARELRHTVQSFDRTQCTEFTFFKEYTCPRTKRARVAVPRAYGRHRFGPPSEDTSLSAPTTFPEFKFTLRPAQARATAQVLQQLRGDHPDTLLKASCGSGKTICALWLAKQLGQKVGIIVHTSYLMEQVRE